MLVCNLCTGDNPFMVAKDIFGTAMMQQHLQTEHGLTEEEMVTRRVVKYQNEEGIDGHSDGS